MGRIIKLVLPVCLPVSRYSYSCNFCMITMKFCTEFAAQKVRMLLLGDVI